MLRYNPLQKGPGSAALVNSLSSVQAMRIVEDELARFSKKVDGCIVSTRSLAKGQYPRRGIKGELPNKFKTVPKSQCKVEVTHLILRAHGRTIPDYADNIDVVHTCHNGKAKSNGDLACITYEHLDLDSHNRNMKTQNCRIITQCPFCRMKSKTCTHTPVCRDSNEDILLAQKKPKRITIEYEDGSIVNYNF
jgi:hypothetical protein